MEVCELSLEIAEMRVIVRHSAHSRSVPVAVIEFEVYLLNFESWPCCYGLFVQGAVAVGVHSFTQSYGLEPDQLVVIVHDEIIHVAF